MADARAGFSPGQPDRPDQAPLPKGESPNSTSVVKAAVERYKECEAALQSRLIELYQAVERERQELSAQRTALDAERVAFNEEKSRVQHVLDDNEQVVLNVGGTRFTTTVMTLRNAPSPSLFSAMFSGRHCLKRDDAGSIFIDRDGRHFHVILNYLRGGALAYPPDGSDWQFLLELRAEAEFYGLLGLVALIDRYPFGLTIVHRAVSVNDQDSWMYEDGADEVVVSVDQPCQLLGVGLCGTDGSFTAELTVAEVAAEDFTHELSGLGMVAQTFSKLDGQTVRLMLPAPVHLLPDKCYMLSVAIQGTDSYCCEDCCDAVVVGGVRVRFHPWESPNGTNELRGQFPELYIRVI